jgi:DNA repair protein RadA
LAHIYSRIKEVVLQDIPDITSDLINKLKDLRIDSVSQLAVQIPIELALKLENDKVDVESANRLVANARKLLTECEILSKEFSTADDFASGKSQICHTLCIAANKPIEKSGLDNDTNDSDKINQSKMGNIIYVDTENTFRSERVYQIAEQNGLDPLAVLETIYHCSIYNSEELESIIDNLDKFIEQYNAKLVIVDSIISFPPSRVLRSGNISRQTAATRKNAKQA